ncbi:MAG: WYL domain-containing protein [Schwartzia succinivorans]|nr:WYL domain-containing protein [Schwartzia succinivorans]
MAALFNNENALLLHILCRVVSEISNGKRLTESDIKKRLSDAFPGEAFFTGETEQEVIDALFPSRYENVDSDKLKPFYEAPVPSLPSDNERLWLKTMLLDESVAFLLPDELREKLLSRLADTPNFSLAGVWEKRQPKGDNPAEEPLRGKLALIWKALREKKKLRYANIDKSGTRHEQIHSPCRLEYDAAINRFFLIVWNEKERRAVKINIQRLEILELAEDPIPPDTEKSFMDFLAKRKGEVVFRLVDKDGTDAFDRCYSLFSAYDKEACAEEENVYTIKVHFQDFDQQEIISRLLFLGSAVTVLEPEDIKDEMIECLKQAWEYYREE